MLAVVVELLELTDGACFGTTFAGALATYGIYLSALGGAATLIDFDLLLILDSS